MATTSKYAVLSAVDSLSDWLDLDLNFGSVTLDGQDIKYVGSRVADAVFIRPGVAVDFTSAGGGVDKLYLSGNFADYSLTQSGAYAELTRTVDGKQEKATVAAGDTLIFADGYVSTTAVVNYVKSAGELPVLNASETSLDPQIAATQSASVKAAAIAQTGVTFSQSTEGVALKVVGGSGTDTVYIKAGTKIDVSSLGGGVDQVYFTGSYAEYTKSLSGASLVLERTIDGHQEQVTLAVGDKAVFADGSVTTLNIKNNLTAVPPPGWNPAEITPGVSHIESIAVSSNPGGDLTYKAGDVIEFAVTMKSNKAVNVFGSPVLTFKVGDTDVQAAYDVASSTTTVLKFKYTVLDTQFDANGISYGANAVSGGLFVLSNGSGATVQMLNVAHADIAGQQVDGIAPTITTSALDMAENGLKVGAMEGADTGGAVTWSIAGTGADDSKFSITADGVLTVKTAKNFEAADDVGGTASDGIYVVQVNATDAAGNVTSQAINVTLTNVNEVPTIAHTIVDQTFVIGDAVDTFVVPADIFADVDADTTITYSATLADGSALPSWLTFDAATRTFTGNPTEVGTLSVRVTGSDGELSTYDHFVLSSVDKPILSSKLDGVTNFDVRSDIVLSSTENVTAVAGKYIHIINDGGAGYDGESTVHTQDILATDATQVTISNGKITINPLWDLDLANNYHITIDDGAFVGVTTGLGSKAIADATTLNFSTVSPFVANASSAMSSAEASQMMEAGTDAVVASGAWFSVAGIGDTSDADAGATFDLDGGNYVIVGGKDECQIPTDLSNSESGITLSSTMWVQLNNFGLKDSIYIDDQFNNPAYTNNIEGDPSAVAEQSSTLSRIAVPANSGQGWFDVVMASEVGIAKFNSISELASASNAQAVLVA